MGSHYRKLRREQEDEEGIWFDKVRHGLNRQLYSYVSKKYGKLLNKCVLYQILNSTGRAFGSTEFAEFVRLDLSRDRLERAMRLKAHDMMKVLDQTPTVYSSEGQNKKKPAFTLNYGFLRGFYLKKLLVSSLVPDDKRSSALLRNEFLEADLRSEIVKNLFDAFQPEQAKPEEQKLEVSEILLSTPKKAESNLDPSSGERSYARSPSSIAGSAMSSLSVSLGQNYETMELEREECLPKSMG